MDRQSGIYGLTKSWMGISEQLGVRFEPEFHDDFPQDPHPIPARARLALTIHGKKVLLDGQDQNTISEGMIKKLQSEDYQLIVKMQYRPGNYGNCQIPISSFTYYTVTHDACMIARAKRMEVLKSGRFDYSIMWAGTCKGLPQRQAIKTTLKSGRHTWFEQVDLGEYIDKAVHSAAGIMARGRGVFCHRDMEFMCMGTACISRIYTNTMANPLIPNYHYYPSYGDNEPAIQFCRRYMDLFDRRGVKKFSKEEKERYLGITANAMKWYDENASPEASLRLLLRILESNRIISKIA